MQKTIDALHQPASASAQLRIDRQRYHVNGAGQNPDAHDITTVCKSTRPERCAEFVKNGNSALWRQYSDEAHAEFQIVDKLHVDKPRVCACGQHGCFEINFVQNRYNGNILPIGSVCIHKFADKVHRYYASKPDLTEPQFFLTTDDEYEHSSSSDVVINMGKRPLDPTPEVIQPKQAKRDSDDDRPQFTLVADTLREYAVIAQPPAPVFNFYGPTTVNFLAGSRYN